MDGRPPAEGLEGVPEGARLEGALLPVERRPPQVPRVGRGAPEAVRPQHPQVAEVEGGGLGVRDVHLAPRLHEDAARAADAPRRAEAQQPAHHVEHVNADVADGAVAVLHEGPPVPRVDELVVGPHRGRPRPELVVERRGRRDLAGVLGVHQREVAVGLDVADATQLARPKDLVPRLDQVGRAAPLRAHLHDPAVAPRGRDHGLPLHHVHADRLLDVHVGPGLDRRDRGQGVPVVGGADDHEVEVALGQHLPVVGVGARGLLRRLSRRDLGGGVREHRGVDVAERHDLRRRRDLQQPEEVALAVPARADHPDPQARVGEDLGVATETRERDGGRAPRAEEMASSHGRRV